MNFKQVTMLKMSREWRPYICWTLRLLILGAVGVLLIPLLLKSTGENDRVDPQTLPFTVHGIGTAEQVTVDASFSKIHNSLKNEFPFSSFNGLRVFENRGYSKGIVARKPFQLEQRMFDEVQEEAVRYLKGRGRHDFSQKDCNDIRYRLLPTAGLEVELICSKSSSSEAEKVVLVLPFHRSRVLLHKHVDAAKVLGIIVPLQGRVETLKRFLSNLEKVVRDGGLHVALTVVYFDDQHTQEAMAALEAARDIEGFQTQFFVLKGEFSRSKGLNLGVEKVTSDVEIVLLCDVDIVFSHGFLLRCLASPSQGHQVFFPVFFSQHNPLLTYSARGWTVPETPTVKIVDQHGFWRIWSFGMVCLHKSDFLKINGFNSNVTGWGGEDVNFAKQVLAMNYSVIRSLDYGLLHPYHPKDCSHAGKNQWESCMKVQAYSEASGQTFGLWYFKNKYNKSMWGVLEDKLKQEEKTEDEEEATKEEKQKRGERNSLGVLEDPNVLRLVLLAMFALNIILCGCVAAICGAGRRRCDK